MITLKEVTFCIPVRYDSDDRINNLKFILRYLNYHFDTNIIVIEQDKKEYFSFCQNFKDVSYIFLKNEDEENLFHRTRCLNICYKKADTPIVVNNDADCFLPVDSYTESVKLINESKADMVIPYESLYHCNKEKLGLLNDNKDFMFNENESYIEKKPNSNVRNGTKNLVGGIVFFNKTSLINIGMENEKYVGWGGEDSDRYERARKLGLKCRRLTYNLYHINHKRGIFSRGHEKYHQNNKDELKYVRGLNAINLKKYIQNWEWYND